MKKQILISFLLLALLVLIPVTSVMAQAEGMRIKLNRDFGYGGMGNQIQGTFSIEVTDNTPYQKVIFMMDEIVLGEKTEAPFRFRFSTDSYEPGIHQYYAIGVLADGTQVESNRITADVLSKEEANQALYKILGILFGSIALVGIISWAVSSVVSKKTAGSQVLEDGEMPQGFSLKGGSICPKCGKPFSFHFFSVNLPFYKVDRCPHCGKVVLAKSMTYQAVETIVLSKKKSKAGAVDNGNGAAVEISEEERLKRQLDDSKYSS